MNRRGFLKSLAASALAPALPIPKLALGATPVSAAPVVPTATYNWAAMIVRAHNNCTLPMLQRHLQIDVAMAEALKSQLIKNGILNAQMNAYGMHTATKPLFDGAFLKPPTPVNSVLDSVKKLADKTDEPAEEDRFEDCETSELSEPLSANDEPLYMDFYEVSGGEISNPAIEWANSRASNGSRSSTCSPTPMK